MIPSELCSGYIRIYHMRPPCAFPAGLTSRDCINEEGRVRACGRKPVVARSGNRRACRLGKTRSDLVKLRSDLVFPRSHLVFSWQRPVLAASSAGLPFSCCGTPASAPVRHAQACTDFAASLQNARRRLARSAASCNFAPAIPLCRKFFSEINVAECLNTS